MKSRTLLLSSLFCLESFHLSKRITKLKEQINIKTFAKIMRKGIIFTALTFMSALIIACIFMNLMGYRPVYGTGVSMKPTFDYFTYLLIDTNDTVPDYGDIISVTINKNDERFDAYRESDGVLKKTSRLSKRVIALPGDDVIISKNNIFVNGEMVKLRGDKVQNNWNPSGHYNVMLEDIDGYFIIGDNIAESLDSTVFGVVYQDNIEGTVSWFSGSKFFSSILE